MHIFCRYPYVEALQRAAEEASDRAAAAAAALQSELEKSRRETDAARREAGRYEQVEKKIFGFDTHGLKGTCLVSSFQLVKAFGIKSAFKVFALQTQPKPLQRGGQAQRRTGKGTVHHLHSALTHSFPSPLEL